MVEALNFDKGIPGVAVELILPKYYTIPWLPDYFTPRFQIGGVGTIGNGISFGYAGALWHLDYTDRLFGEVGFGATVHDAGLHYRGLEFPALRCRFLFHSQL